MIDVLRCSHCGGRRRIASFLTVPKVLRRILNHLGLPSEAPAVKPTRVLAGFDVGLELELAFDVEGSFGERIPWSLQRRLTMRFATNCFGPVGAAAVCAVVLPPQRTTVDALKTET